MAERFEIVEKALVKMLEDKKYITLRDILLTMYPSDIAAIFSNLEEKQIPLMFRLLSKEQAAETFVEMEPDAQELLIKGFSDNELKEVLDELYVDDAADIVEEMPANVVKRILDHANPEMRKSINQILRYPEDSAGSIVCLSDVSLGSPYLGLSASFTWICFLLQIWKFSAIISSSAFFTSFSFSSPLRGHNANGHA